MSVWPYSPLGKQFEQVAERFNTLIRTISESKTFQNLAKVAISTANAFLSVAESLTPLIPLITTLTTIKVTRGIFEFGRGFVGGLSKGGGAGGAGGALGTAVTGGRPPSGGDRDAAKPIMDRALAQAIKNNVTAVRSNTSALKMVNTSLREVDSKMLLLGQTIMNEVRSLVATLRTSGGGFRNPRKFARGGPVHGPSHAAGGVPAVLEGGEYVIPKGYVKGGEVEDFIEVTAKQIGSGISKKRVRRGGGGQRQFGVAYLRPEGMDEQLSYDLDIKDFFPKGLELPDLGRHRLDRATLGPNPQGKKINKLALQKQAIRGAGVGNVAGFSSSLRGGEGSVSVTLHQGSLSETVADQFEVQLKEASRKVAKNVIGAIIGNGFDENSYSKGLDKANPTQSIGNLYEAALGATIGKWDEKRVNANSPFDYPSGLGVVGSKFSIPGTIPTDAKRSFTKETLANLIKKSRNQIDQEAVDSILQESLAARLGGAEGSFTDSKTNLQAYIGRGDRSLEDLGGDFRKLGFDFEPATGGKKGDYTIRPRFKAKGFAAGGSVFSPRGTDTVPAMLTPGEYVINRSSAQAIGYGQLDKMNHMANGGRVQYLAEGSTGPVAAPAGGGANLLISRFGMLASTVAGVTVALSSLDFSSLQNVLMSLTPLAGVAMDVAMLSHFGGSGGLLGGLGKGLQTSAIGKSFGNTGKAFGAAKTAFQRTPFAPIPGRLPAHQLSAPVRGFAGVLKKSSAGIKAFTAGIGGLKGFFAGLPGLITTALAVPLINAAVDASLGKVEEVAPGIRGRRGLSPRGATFTQGGIGAAGGALTGAAIASFIPIPVISQAVGAAVGAVVGGTIGALGAAQEQRLFNIFTEISDAGEGVTDIFEKISKNQGVLDDKDQRRLDKAVTGFSQSFLDVTDVGLSSLRPGSGSKKIRNFFSGGQFDESFLAEGAGVKSREAAGALLKAIDSKFQSQGINTTGSSR